MTNPSADGFFMPAEFEKHHGTIMIWPERPGSWGTNPLEAEKAFTEIIKELSKHEKVYVAVSRKAFERVNGIIGEIAEVFEAETDDSWARDTAPTFIVDKDKRICGIDWKFNAWGGSFDGLYQNYENDDKFAKKVCELLDIECCDAHPFVLEGGSIHSDGEGTLLVTESCLLSKGRNPDLTKEEIEDNLKKYLGAEKIIWLPFGIYNDETNEHVDNVCAFVSPGNVVLAWTDNKDDPQYEMSLADFEVLSDMTDAKGRQLKVHKLPVPDVPVVFSEEDCLGFEFEDGEDMRVEGERLAASYVNFYFANDVVLMPVFGGENAESDKRAKKILASICPDRQIVPIDAYSIIRGGGNIHCITQQIPFFKERGRRK